MNQLTSQLISLIWHFGIFVGVLLWMSIMIYAFGEGWGTIIGAVVVIAVSFYIWSL